MSIFEMVKDGLSFTAIMCAIIVDGILNLTTHWNPGFPISEIVTLRYVPHRYIPNRVDTEATIMQNL